MDAATTTKVIYKLDKLNSQIDELMDHNYEDADFKQWWEALKNIANKLDDHNQRSILSLDFTPRRMRRPGATYLDPEYLRAYQQGLTHTKGVISVIIDDLETFGPTPAPAPAPARASAQIPQIALTINNTQATIIQQQVLQGESPETQALVRELLEQLKQKDKNFPVIKDILGKLVETATPVLVKIFLAHFGLGNQ